MVIDTFEIKDKNIIVNGVKLGWVTVSDLMKIGKDTDSLQQKFEKLCNSKASSDSNIVEWSSNIVEQSNSEEKKERTPKCEVLSFDEVMKILGNSIDRQAKYIIDNSKLRLNADYDDIKQDLTVWVIEDFMQKCGTERQYTNRNVHRYWYKIALKSINTNAIINKYTLANLSCQEVNDIKKLAKAFGDKSVDELGLITKDEVQQSADKLHLECKVDNITKIIVVCNNLENIDDIDIKVDDITSAVDEYVTKLQLKDIVNDILNELTDRQKYVLSGRFGINCEHTKTLSDIGKSCGINRARVGQIERKALMRLSHPSRARRLIDFYW